MSDLQTHSYVGRPLRFWAGKTNLAGNGRPKNVSLVSPRTTDPCPPIGQGSSPVIGWQLGMQGSGL